MAVDIAPELLETLQSDFYDRFNKNKNISKIQSVIREGKPTYAEVNNLSIEAGDILADVFKSNLSSDMLPDGRMYYNIGKRTVEPMMIDNFNIVSTNAVLVQEYLNQQAGLGIMAQAPVLNQDRIDGIINRLDESELFDDVKWILDEPIKNFTQSVADDAVEANVEFQHKLGLGPKIERIAEPDACDWCKNLEGVYNYPDVPSDIYRRHEYCRCTVEYNPSGSRRQNVWNKEWR